MTRLDSSPGGKKDNKLAFIIDASGEGAELSIIGQELHDNVNQILGTIKLFLDVALSNEKKRCEMLLRSKELITYCINEIRNLSHSIAITDLSNIQKAVSKICQDICHASDMRIYFKIDEELKHKMNKEKQVLIFRIIQEQVNNVMKYAYATRLVIRMHIVDNRLQLCINDNGIGFDLKETKSGLGIDNMKKRTASCNGELKIETSVGKGVKLTVKIPLGES